MSPAPPGPVVHVITKLAVGGAQETAIALCSGLMAAGVPVLLLTGPDVDDEGSLLDEARRRGVDVQPVPRLRRVVRPVDDALALVWLVRRFRHLRPAVVHTHSSKAGVLGRVAACLAGVPMIVHTVHGWSFPSGGSAVPRRAAIAVERALARITDAIVVVTARDRDKGLEAGVGTWAQYVVIRSGIDIARFHVPPSQRAARRAAGRDALGLAEDVAVVGGIGRLATQKDPLGFVEAASLLSEAGTAATFVWIGDGPLRAEVERRARELGIADRVRLLGVRHDVERLLPGFDVFALTSRWEGLPRTVVEAGAAAVPVVATAVDGVAELIADGHTGWSVPAGDPHAVAGAIGDALAHPEVASARATALGAAVTEFDETAMVGQTMALYRRGAGLAAGAVRVVHVISGLQSGGAERMVQRLLPAMDAGRFHQVVVSLTGDGPVGAALESAGFTVHRLGLDVARPSPRPLVQLARILRTEQPDVVQTWLYHADLVGGIVACLRRRQVVWNLRNTALDPATTPAHTRIAMRAGARLSGVVPCAIVTNSQQALEAHARLGYDMSRGVVIPNGFDTSVFCPDPDARVTVRAELGLGPDATLVGLVARHDPQKDHATFLAAAAAVAAALPSTRFVLCGVHVDDENRALVDDIAGHGLGGAVSLLGVRADVARITAALDVAVSSSAYGESFPNAVAEALCCGVPVVATDVGAAATIVGTSGRIVSPRHPDALADAVLDLLRLPAEARASLAQPARERISSAYGMEAVAYRYGELYASLARATTRTSP